MSLPIFLKSFEGFGVFELMDPVTASDGYGGYHSTYRPGARFEAVLTLDDSIQAQTAEAEGVTGVYTVTYDKALHLPWHTVFRKADKPSEVFRVTSKDERSTPGTTSIDMRQVTAEEWTLTGGMSDG